jgi:hypothetical protein
MNHPRTAPEIDVRGRRRVQLREDAIVAQYIHELSDRHGRPDAGDGTDPSHDGELAAPAHSLSR